MHNHNFWRRHFQRKFVPHLRRLLETLSKRLLPAFDGLEDEANKVQEDTFAELMAMPGDPDSDLSVLAEAAHDASLDHYFGMCDVRQALLNSFAAILYHAWEQQLLEFHRREVLHPADQHDPKLMSLKVLLARLHEKGLSVANLPSWGAIEELRLVANTTKHADGDSAAKLKTLRPDLFEHPSARDSGLPKLRFIPPVYAPLSGNDLYVGLNDLRRYGDAVTSFWDELALALARADA
jgi:hypothetical protein